MAENYPGIYSLKKKKIESVSAHLSKENIDRYVLPDRKGFEHEHYQELSLKATGEKKTTIMMTYGCPYACDFCSKPILGTV